MRGILAGLTAIFSRPFYIISSALLIFLEAAAPDDSISAPSNFILNISSQARASSSRNLGWAIRISSFARWRTVCP